ncbi:polysaccharide deacetylase family protein [Streptomyces finlayi]|uniref:polysaccharide deacetylase family protein n=1 Tax=Streptomyces finlayi TaxID=67296 RepID=UPI001E603567|nr:polysaccharide deacetylase family protein [Streptomyces finlayi]
MSGGRVRRSGLWVAGALAVGVLAVGASGCSGGGSGEGVGEGPSKTADHPTPAPTAPGHPAPAAPQVDARGVPPKAYTRWGLAKPLAPPPATPDRTPALKPSGPPVVLDRVKTNDKVVFLTYDDGAEKDPAFVKMVADLKLPITMFLTDSVAGSNYDHFKKLRDAGNGTIQNHTTGHANLRTLSYEAQRKQICDQQDRLEHHFGTRPTLFRPPYGNYNKDTVRAAGTCGVKALVLWRESMQIHNMQYAEGKRLKPGDIVLAHFRGPSELKGSTITEMTTRMLRRIQDQGFTIARLEDYL